MSANDYLKEILRKYDKNHTYNQYEENAFNSLKNIISEWFNNSGSVNSAYSYYYKPTMEVQKSGSRAKGTAIKGSSDMDMFLSITDRNNEDTLQNYYNEIYEFLKNKGYKVRKQNVSIGVQYCGYDIDVVPAKKSNQSSYTKDWRSYADHWLWSNKKQQRTKTNIQKHIDVVKDNYLQNYVMLTKIWRNNHGLDFPSIYIELMVYEALNKKRVYDLEEDFYYILSYIRDNIENKKIVDPSNSQNIISDSLSIQEKASIKKAVVDSFTKQYWSQVIW